MLKGITTVHKCPVLHFNFILYKISDSLVKSYQEIKLKTHESNKLPKYVWNFSKEECKLMSNEYRKALCKAIEVLETQKFEKIMNVIKECMQRNSNIYLFIY